MNSVVSASAFVLVEVSDSDQGLSICVETERLRITSIKDKFEPQLVELYGSSEVNALVGTGATLTPDAVRAKIKRWFARFSAHNPLAGYVVTEKTTNTFVADIVLKPIKDRSGPKIRFLPGIIEIGFLSTPTQMGKGYAKEYTNAVIHHLVPKLMELGYGVKESPDSSKIHRIEKIMATTSTLNVRCQSVLLKSMSFMGVKLRYGSDRHWYEHTYE